MHSRASIAEIHERYGTTLLTAVDRPTQSYIAAIVGILWVFTYVKESIISSQCDIIASKLGQAVNTTDR